jgi:hypothetical protein
LKRALPAIWILVCLCGALLMAHHPMLLSRMANIQTDPGDTRLNNYFLEHSYLWLQQSGLHRNIWNPPFFYPHENSAAYSDLMLGVAPFYWVWRSGFEPDTAFQLWMITITALNFLIGYLFLKRIFKISIIPASLAAVFFTAANSRISQLSHQQLLSHLFLIAAIWAIFKFFEPDARKWIWIGVFFGSVVLQLYSGFYIGFFLILVAGISIAWALAFKNLRYHLLLFFKNQWPAIAICAVIAAVLLLPWAQHYMAAQKEVGRRSYSEVKTAIMLPASWFNMGPDNLLYGWTANKKIFATIPMNHEQRMGLGFITVVAFISGLWMRRKDPRIKIILLAASCLILLATQFHPAILPLWQGLYAALPGAGAIRAVSRLGMIMAVPAMIGLALLLEKLFTSRRKLLVAAVVLLAPACLAEQVNFSPWYNKYAVRAEVAKVAAIIDPKAQTFYLTVAGGEPEGLVQLTAMWAGLKANKPVINGYTGNAPPGWQLAMAREQSYRQHEELAERLRDWIELKHLAPERVQWLGPRDWPQPGDYVTREEMAAFVIRRLEGERSRNYCSNGSLFTDVSPGNVFCGDIKRLRELGITQVIGNYMPEELVTRGQMAAFLIRAKLGDDFSYSTTPFFSDVPRSHTFFRYVQKLKDLSVISFNGNYYPDRLLKRTELADFLNKVLMDKSANIFSERANEQINANDKN